ncbi:uncharacterized protein PFL1_03346 [Pseudozyma flocculosa PF-1]|uniref:MARVEL domain-containing protein n=2 Tax=Pseudozyma flocculosa TaxID=84751 RepID=A0A5C3F9I8_9BASI|nr:uncharacterized protein PFL1_03346 [Pseudozyma flocculosa PF-1]EPQ29057.1 hypothetical protein PFL1_03346 [Pseudozyma flocculosa PF-1]SPO40051.1 uncharacterized protein PSFLO_05533 [Pseudozyma flocculosa]
MGRRQGLEFCCLGVPLVNAGAYLVSFEFLFVSICLVVLAICPPPIVAAMGVLPPWYKLALIGLGGFSIALQVLGLLTILRQSIGWYRAYIRINFATTLTVIVVSTIGTVVMALAHDKASAICKSIYGNEPINSGLGFRVDYLSDALKDSGRMICNVFTYVQVGAIGGLIALVGLTQLYMCYCQRVYGQRQREAWDKMHAQDHDYGDSSTDKFDLSTSSSSLVNPHKV